MISRFYLILVIAIAAMASTSLASAQHPPVVPDIRGGRDGDNIGVSWVKTSATLTYEIDRQAGGSDEWVPLATYPVHLPVDQEIIYTEPLRLGPGPYCFRVRAIENGVASGYVKACIPVSPATSGTSPAAPVVSGTMTSSGGGGIGEPYWRLDMSWPSVVPAGDFNGYETWVLGQVDRNGNSGETIYRHMDTIIATGATVTFGSWGAGLTAFPKCVKVRAIQGSQAGPFSDPICRPGDTKDIAYQSGGAVPAAQTGANPDTTPYTAPATITKEGAPSGAAPTPRPPSTGSGTQSGAERNPIGVFAVFATLLGSATFIAQRQRRHRP